ncbi:MAG: hypothetical protein J6N93_06010 [Clostridia bacterium]|nr:hypothetical protein [Clostridia bacterium]
MRKFYVTYGDLSNLPPAVANLTWTHNCILTDKVKELNAFGMRKNAWKMVGAKWFSIIKRGN